MRVMFDTNTLISAIVFNSKPIWKIINCLAYEHSIVLCSYVVHELHDVVKRKFPYKAAAVDQFLFELPFEYVYTSQNIKEKLFEIRDGKDYPILYTAIKEDVDIFITGDKDFSDIDIERPEILTPAQFLQKHDLYNKF